MYHFVRAFAVWIEASGGQLQDSHEPLQNLEMEEIPEEVKKYSMDISLIEILQSTISRVMKNVIIFTKNISILRNKV